MEEPSSSFIDDLETGQQKNHPPPKKDVVNDHRTATRSLSSSQSKLTAFVDYVPPPEKPVPPPAVYKLVLIIATTVCFADWVASEAGLLPFWRQRLSLSPEGALLVFLAMVVFVLVYGTLDLIILFKIPILTFLFGDGDDDNDNNNNNTQTHYLGVETWLKQPRTRWIHGYPNNVVMECLATVISTLEDGLDIFKKEDIVAPPAVKQFEDDVESSDDDENNRKRGRDILLRIESLVKPDHRQDYIRWRERLLRLGARPGMKKVDYHTTTPSSSSSSLDEENNLNDIEKEPHLFVTHILFDSVEALNDFMASPFRERMLRKLQPLLEAPPALQLCQQRCLADAFTDLCHGQSVPKRNPKKWKVWILTTLSLWIVLQFTHTRLPPYLEAWGLVPQAHPRAAAAVGIFNNVFLNS